MTMNLIYSEQDREFRASARAWLATNVPKSSRPANGLAGSQFDRAWQRRLFDHGWAGVAWPKDYGGLGLSGLQQVIWYEELARASAPHHINTTYVGLMHAGPTLIACGTETQKALHLPRILSGEHLWCQGFSEANAGSDLASLKTRGVIDGEYLVVTGTKMWTTDAAYADYQELLVRTGAESQRHKGLTWIICDMRTPGITIQPIRTMLNDEHVNMVFYDEVRIPLSNVVGNIGGGWSTALSTLSFERGIGFIGDQLELYERVCRAIELASQIRLDNGKTALEDEAFAQRLASIKADAMALRAMTLSSVAELDYSREPKPKSSLLKLMVTKTHKALTEVVGEMLGWDFLEFDGDRSAHPWTYEYLWSWVFSIAGGTTEIQREITADRLLGLPRAR
jgi:alkylation response protein AidB-like acyl-CoA dehydrogenase